MGGSSALLSSPYDDDMSDAVGAATNEMVIPGDAVTQRQAVDYLVQRLDELQSRSDTGPRIVLLRGASGIGKSWTIQSLYDRLRTTMEDKYWPDLTAHGSATSPLADRKQIAPDPRTFTWNKNVLPTFGWWAFNCERLAKGSLQSVLNDASAQIAAHTVPLDHRWREVANIPTRAARAKQTLLKRIIDIAHGEAHDAVLSLLTAGIPFAGAAADALVEGGRHVLKQRKQKQDLAATIDVGSRLRLETTQKSYELASVFEGLALRGLPAVIAIEDVQLIGPELRDLVDAVTEPDDDRSPILVVGTVWPEAFLTPDSDFAQWVTQTERDGRVKILDLAALDHDALGKIVREYAPATAPEVEARVVQPPLDSPYYLKLWLSSRETQRHIRKNGDALGAHITQSFPKDAEAVLDGRWNELRAGVQDALLCATTVNPLSDDRPRDFVPQVIDGVLEKLGEEYWEDWWTERTRDGKSTALRAAIDPAEWCREQDGVQFFVDATLADTARRKLQNYDEEERHEIAQATRRTLIAWFTSDDGRKELVAQSSAARVAGSWFAQLPSEDDKPDEGALSPESLLSIAQSQARWGDYETAVTHVEPELTKRAR